MVNIPGFAQGDNSLLACRTENDAMRVGLPWIAGTILVKKTIDEFSDYMIFSKKQKCIDGKQLLLYGTESRWPVRTDPKRRKLLVPEQDLRKRIVISGSRSAPLSAVDLLESERDRFSHLGRVNQGGTASLFSPLRPMRLQGRFCYPEGGQIWKRSESVTLR